MASTRFRILSLLLALAMCATVPVSAAEATAATVQLMKAEGSVTVTNRRSKEQKIRENMRLYSGSHVETGEASYAWLDLDASKLTKLDAASELEIRKSGKELELLLNAGNLYFNVTSPLEEDESLNIRTSTMMAGIRGTSGWVQVLDQYHTRVYVLQGRVECSVTDPLSGQTKTTVLLGGDTAEFVVYDPEKAGDKCDIIRKRYSEEEARGFTLVELAPDAPHREKIRDDSGLDFSDDMDAARDRLAQDEAETHNKLLPIRYEYNNQDHEVSHDPVWPENVPDPSDNRDDDDSGDVSEPPEEKPPSTSGIVTMTMQVPDEDVDAALARPDVTGVRLVPAPAGMDSTLHIDDGITVPEGKTLTLDAGVDALVYPGINLRIDGTMTLQSDDLVNNGTIFVNSANTLRVGGNLVNNGTLVITDVGRVVVDGTFSSSTELGLGQTAQALAKTFASDIRLPQNWSVSATTDSQGYYSLVYVATYNISISGTVQEEVSGTAVASANVKVTQKGAELGSTTSAADGSYSIDVAVTSDAPYELVFTASGYKELSVQQTATGSGNVTYNAELTPTTVTYNISISGTVQEEVSGTPVANANVKVTQKGVDLGTVTSASNGSYSLNVSVTSDAPYEMVLTPTGNDYKKLSVQQTATASGNITYDAELTPTTVKSFLSADNKTLTIYGTGNMTNYANASDVPWATAAATIETVTIKEGITRIGNYAFRNCTNLTSVTIPDSVTVIGNEVFRNCTSLTSVTIPAGVTVIQTNTFRTCTTLTSVTIPEGVTWIEEGAFYDCTNLTGVTLPNSVRTIERLSFSYCSSMTSINIPEGVTAINQQTFEYCSGLTSITIPDSVTSIGNYAFNDCTALTDVYYAGTEAEWTTLLSSIGTGNGKLTGATPHFGS